MFVLHSRHVCYIWVGKGSIGDERECAREVMRLIWKPDDADLVMEGREPDNFWNMLGGKAEYGSAKQIWVGSFRLRRKFQLSVESNPGLHWFCFTTLCDWSRKLAPPSQPIRYKTKTNHDLVTRVFPRLRLVTCIYFRFSLVRSDIYLRSDWPL